MRTETEPKTERIDIRTTAQVKHLLQQAATAARKNLSDFLLEHGLAAAEETLADRRFFVLDDARWEAFLDALDRPATSRPRLARLLQEPGAFD